MTENDLYHIEKLRKKFSWSNSLSSAKSSLANLYFPLLMVLVDSDFSKGAMALAYLLPFAMGAILELPTGVFADRIGWRKTLMISYFSTILTRIFELFLLLSFHQI